MNLTLFIDDSRLARARKKADSLGKSLDQLVSDHLRDFVADDDPEGSVEELYRLSGRGDSRDERFNRDEIHQRGGLR